MIKHNFGTLLFCAATAVILVTAGGCERTSSPAAPALPAVPVSKITSANYDSIRLGMSKGQVEAILGAPTTAETKDMVVFKKTTYRYEDGTKFILLTFKNDELDSKDSNLAAHS